MTSIESTRNGLQVTLSASKDEKRIYITGKLKNISNSTKKFSSSNSSWCTIFLYTTKDKNTKLEQSMHTAACETWTLEPGEDLVAKRKTDIKQDWVQLTEELNFNLDECVFVDLDKEQDIKFTASFKVKIETELPTLNLTFQPKNLPIRSD